jgi:hypothetical protein
MWWTKRSWSAEAEEARAKVESQEGSESLSSAEKAKLTRRQALARFGFQAGAAAVAALTADDLLRKVGEEMQKRAGDSEVANAVAKEFKNAGVVFADVADVVSDTNSEYDFSIALRPPCSDPNADPPQEDNGVCGHEYEEMRAACSFYPVNYDPTFPFNPAFPLDYNNPRCCTYVDSSCWIQRNACRAAAKQWYIDNCKGKVGYPDDPRNCQTEHNDVNC